MRIALLNVLLIVLLGACSKSNPNYCEGHPDNNCMVDADVNAPQGCQANDDCTNAAKPLCDLGAKVCVACLDGDIGACDGATPVCTSEHTCAACAAHTDCDSRACLPDGSCAMESQVAYVSASGSGNACTKMAPCPLLKDAIGKDMPYVKIAAEGAAKDSSTVTIDGKTVTILADPGATLDRDGDGVVLEVRSANADVRIYDLAITGASGISGGDGIRIDPNGGLPRLTLTRCKVVANQGIGLRALDGTVIVSRSNFAGNSGGAIQISEGTFEIIGNVFFSNGNDASAFGALSLFVKQGVSDRLDFNSFSKNQATDGVGAAITCTGNPLTARNNILSGNGTLTNSEQVSGANCTHEYSIVRPGTLPSGTGNSAEDPLFANTTTGDLHIMAGSPAIGAADPSSDLSGVAEQDLDGQIRQLPADIGADELP